MQISSRFTIAIHVLICIDVFKGQWKATSEMLATSVNANPVIIRRLLQQLKTAGIVNVVRGSGGAELACSLNQITLLDIYNAVECVENGALFHFHENPNELCPIGRNIHKILDSELAAIQQSMEKEMRSITMADLVRRAKKTITSE